MIVDFCSEPKLRTDIRPLGLGLVRSDSRRANCVSRRSQVRKTRFAINALHRFLLSVGVLVLAACGEPAEQTSVDVALHADLEEVAAAPDIGTQFSEFKAPKCRFAKGKGENYDLPIDPSAVSLVEAEDGTKVLTGFRAGTTCLAAADLGDRVRLLLSEVAPAQTNCTLTDVRTYLLDVAVSGQMNGGLEWRSVRTSTVRNFWSRTTRRADVRSEGVLAYLVLQDDAEGAPGQIEVVALDGKVLTLAAPPRAAGLSWDQSSGGLIVYVSDAVDESWLGAVAVDLETGEVGSEFRWGNFGLLAATSPFLGSAVGGRGDGSLMGLAAAPLDSSEAVVEVWDDGYYLDIDKAEWTPVFLRRLPNGWLAGFRCRNLAPDTRASSDWSSELVPYGPDCDESSFQYWGLASGAGILLFMYDFGWSPDQLSVGMDWTKFPQRTRGAYPTRIAGRVVGATSGGTRTAVLVAGDDNQVVFVDQTGLQATGGVGVAAAGTPQAITQTLPGWGVNERVDGGTTEFHVWRIGSWPEVGAEPGACVDGLVCDDNDGCTRDGCDSKLGCTHQFSGAMCKMGTSKDCSDVPGDSPTLAFPDWGLCQAH